MTRGILTPKTVWVILLSLSAYGQYPRSQVPAAPGVVKGIYIVDAGGRTVRSLEVGSSLHVGVRNLRPSTTYEFRLALNRAATNLRNALGFARSTSDAQGNIAPFVLWYQSGVVGCADRAVVVHEPGGRFQRFEQAELALRGAALVVSVHPVERDPTGRRPPMQLKVGEAEATFRVPLTPRRSPMIFASNADGCLLNSQLGGEDDVFVTGRNFRPGERIEISVVENRRSWAVGDPVRDVTGPGFSPAPETVRADSRGQFTVRVWERGLQRRGAYDIVARRPGRGRPGVLSKNNIVSYLAETGFILFLHYPVGGPTMDIAGRPLNGSPYFEFADSFSDQNDPVWGAVDPTYVPATHPGGSYAAYYVVAHRDVNGWDPGMGGSTSLTDVSGGIEIHPVKAGCINGTDVIIWNAPLTPGNYDVVVDFGPEPATSPANYSTDGNYDQVRDFLDGADQIGFVVARDPYELGPIPVGRASYSQDDFFPTLGGASDVDLRAVVRYPATTAGDDTPVAAGQHPLFLIEHGNHFHCRDGVWTPHATCTNRVRNHEGYMRLLEILASHGIIAVSIDAYDLTGAGVPFWIPERSDLILKHIELWSHMHDLSTFTSYPDFFAGRFKGHVDLSKIAVSGHSRGGEASVGAFVRNTNFTMSSVSSIAPVDVMSYVLPDVPYCVILPSADGDVSNLSGARIYDRAGSALAVPDSTMKSGVDVYGANHNFFNTVWAADGDESSAARQDYIPAADQQKLGEALLAACVRSCLKGETVYVDLLRGKLRFPSFSGRKVYAFHHEKNHGKVESGSGSPGSSGAVTVTTVGPPVSVHQTQAKRVTWTAGTAAVTYQLPIGQRDVSPFEVFSFRAAQTNASSNPPAANQDFEVALIEGSDVKATFVGQFGPIPAPYPHPYGYKQNVMTTVRVPLHSFIMNNSGVDLKNIDTVRFRFLSPSQGEIYVDDIEFSR